jgi:hypothetical protein
MGVASSIVTAAGWIMNRGQNLGVASQQIHRLLRGKEWEDAYTAAVAEAKKSFKQCNRCSGWVCQENCFNVEKKQCRLCAPNLAEEAVSMKAQAGKVQLFTDALASDQTGGRDMSLHQVSRCPHCNARTSGGKFCTDCGKSIFIEVFCVDCGAEWTSDRNYKFCPSCGETMPEPQTLPTFGARAKSEKTTGTKPGSVDPEAAKAAHSKAAAAAKTTKNASTSKVTRTTKPAAKTVSSQNKSKSSKTNDPAAKTAKSAKPTATLAKSTKPSKTSSASKKVAAQTKKRIVALTPTKSAPKASSRVARKKNPAHTVAQQSKTMGTTKKKMK